MTPIKVLESLSAVIKDPFIEEQIRERFTPILRSSELIETISSISEESPVFKDQLSKLSESIRPLTSSDFVEVYNSFYNNVIIISDELAHGIKKNVDQLSDVKLPLDKGNNFISSRVFVGNSILLTVTSHDALFRETLKIFNS